MAEATIARGIYYHASDGWRWRTLGGNGEPMGSGESYPDMANCVAALRAHLPFHVEPEHDRSLDEDQIDVGDEG